MKTIVTFLIECIYCSQQKIENGQGNHEDQNLSIFTANILSEVIDLARNALEEVQFPLLFLSIARQLEPHHCNHLFPILSASGSNADSNLEDAPLVLYMKAAHAGSLSIASSALPLLSQKRLSHQRCIKLLHHCLTRVLQSCQCVNRHSISFLSQECLLMLPLFQYALKIEESFPRFNRHVQQNYRHLQNDSDGEFYDTESSLGSDDTISFDEYDTLDEDEGDFHPKQGGNVSMIKSFFSPSRLFYSSAKKDMEKAISEAAVSFVSSGYDGNLTGQEYEPQRPEDHGSSDHRSVINQNVSARKFSSVTAADIVGKAFISQLSISLLETEDKEGSRLRGLDNIAVLSMVLNQGETSPSEEKVNQVKKVINGISRDHLLTSLRGIRTFSSVEDTLSALLRCCSKQWNQQSACAIFDIMLQILSHEIIREDPTTVSLLGLLLLYSGKFGGKDNLFLPEEQNEFFLRD